MASRFKTGVEKMYRVVGEFPADVIVARRLNKVPLPEYAVLHGPYTSESTAKALATKEQNDEIFMHDKYGTEPHFVDIFVQVVEPTWTRL